MPITKLSANQRLFRGVKNIYFENETDVENILNNTLKSINKNIDPRELFSFGITTSWNFPSDINKTWLEGSGVFTTTSLKQALWFAGNGITLEIVPKPGKIAAFAKPHEREIIIDQIEPDEIAAIYISGIPTTHEPNNEQKFTWVEKIYKNPNFHGIEEGYEIASLKEGWNPVIQFDEEYDEAHALTKKQIGYYHDKYANKNEFLRLYNSEDVRETRKKLQGEFQNYQNRLGNYLNHTDYSLQKIYQKLKRKISNKKIINSEELELIKNRVDELGDSLIALAIIDRNKEIYDLCVKNNFNLTSINFNQQNLLHLAVKHQFNNVINDLIDRSINPYAKDIESFTPMFEAFNTNNFKAIEILKSKAYL